MEHGTDSLAIVLQAGLDVEQHTILEVACLVTDGDLETVIEVRPLRLPFQLDPAAR